MSSDHSGLGTSPSALTTLAFSRSNRLNALDALDEQTIEGWRRASSDSPRLLQRFAGR